MDTTSKIEAILFYKGEPVSIKRLSEMLELSGDETAEAISLLTEKLRSENRGVRVMENAGSVMLASAPEASALIEGIMKEELARDLGKAAVETLSVVLYLGPIPRSRVDWIRGVNSTFILRNLMVRGLIERISNPNDERSFLYRPTFELLAHLGVARADEIPDYEMVRTEIASFESESAPEQKETETGENPSDPQQQ